MDPERLLRELGLFYDSSYKALICCDEKCQRAISIERGRPTDHLRTMHKLPAEARQNLSQVLDQLDVYDPKLITPLTDGSPAHPYLRIYNGYRCSRCDKRTRDEQEARKHRRCLALSVDSSPATLGNKIMRMEPVYLQIWNSSRSQRYWIVQHNGSTTPPSRAMLRTRRHIAAVQQRELERTQRPTRDDNARDDNARDDNDNTNPSHHCVPGPRELRLAMPNLKLSFAEESPWVARTGWEEMFHGKDRQLLAALITMPRRESVSYPSPPLSSSPSLASSLSLPSPLVMARRGVCGLERDLISSAEDELKIAAIAKLVDQMMERCEETIRSTSRNILCWLKSVKLTSPTQEPFMLVRMSRSAQGYRLVHKKLLAFVCRVYRLDKWGQKRLIGLRLGDEVMRFLDAIWHSQYWHNAAGVAGASENYIEAELDLTLGSEDGILGDMTNVSEEDSDEDSDEECVEYDESGDDDASRRHYPGTLHKKGRKTNNIYAGKSSPSSLRKREATHPERQQSRAQEEMLELLFGLSLALSQETPTDGKPGSMTMVFFSGILGFSKDQQRFLAARAFTSHLSALVYNLRLFCIEKALPLRPYHLLKIGKRPRTKQLERLYKVRKELTIQGPPSPFDELFTLRNYGRVMAKSDTPPFLLYWSDDGQTVRWNSSKPLTMDNFKLLQGHFIKQAGDICHQLMFAFEPDVDLANIEDDMTNSTAGYSFVTDPANSLQEAFLELVRRASGEGYDSLITNGRWRWRQIDRYLKLEERFRTFLGLAMQGDAQRARWSELLQVWCENGEFGQRGMFIHKSFIIHVIRHHKAKRSTNREFVVARFLSAPLTRIVYKYLVYVRRFVDLLYRERSSRGTEAVATSPLLFRAKATLNTKAWPSTRFNEALKAATSSIWSQPVNTQVMRQLSIGITKKHVQEIYEPFNRFDDKGPNASRNVVFSWQSGHRPGENGRSYGLDGAFPTAMQPQLLDLYQWVSMRWHEFLGVASKSTSPQARVSLRNVGDKVAEVTRGQDASLKMPRSEDANSTCSVQQQTLAQSSGPVQSNTSASRDSASAPLEQHELGVATLTVQQAIERYQIIFAQLDEVSPTQELEQHAIMSSVNLYREERAEDYMLQQRVNTLLKTVEWWELLGCPLCFAETGEMEPDHGLKLCQGRHARPARQILLWLTNLAIPRLTHFKPGACVICAGICRGMWVGARPCQEIRLGDAISEARDEETRQRALQEYKNKEGKGGDCHRKSRMYEVIAALCACQNQTLSGILTQAAREQDGVDLLIDAEARSWFERRIPLEDGWFPGIVFAYETLMVGFYHHRNSLRGSPPLYGFPRRPAGY